MSDDETREYLVTYTRKPTNYHPRQTMLVQARDEAEAERTWRDAIVRRGEEPFEYGSFPDSFSVRLYDPGTVGKVVRG